MKETERIATQLEHSLSGEAWHGPALLEVLEGLAPANAAAKPVAGWHSIWELVNHVVVWERVALERLARTPHDFELGGPEDWPPVPEPVDAKAWAAAIDTLRATTKALAAAIRALPEETLDQPILEKRSSRYVTLHGVVQHNLYHAGQIVVLKRALGLPAITPAKAL